MHNPRRLLSNDLDNSAPPLSSGPFSRTVFTYVPTRNLKVQISPPDRWLLPVMRTLVSLLPFTGMEQCIGPAKPSQTI